MGPAVEEGSSEEEISIDEETSNEEETPNDEELTFDESFRGADDKAGIKEEGVSESLSKISLDVLSLVMSVVSPIQPIRIEVSVIA
jgi:hypothetical protein